MSRIQIAGAVLFLIFYGSYFAKAYGEKKRGISAGRMMRGRKPVGTRVIESFLMSITCLLALVQVLSVVRYDTWERLLPGGGFVAAGLLIAVAGTAIFLLAMRQMKDNWRAGIDEGQETSLVTEGIYRFSRNPAFAGFDLYYIGYGMIFSNGLLLLFTVLAVFTFHMQIREEEKYMKKRYGAAYADYKKRVRRYL